MPRRAALLLLTLLLASCAAAPPPIPTAAAGPFGGEHPRADGTRFQYDYFRPEDPGLLPFYQSAIRADFLNQLPEIKAIDGLFVLPNPIRYVMAECGRADAFYSRDNNEVVVCYEQLGLLLQRGEELARARHLGDAYPQRYVIANLRYILLHETGHALIELLDIPATGRQEDAVDQLATMLMQHFAALDESPATVSENLDMAANWLLAHSTGEYDLAAYADEHALGEQRFFNIQCLIYGSDPVRFAGIVASKGLTPERAKGCPAEAKRVFRAWLRLLLPHVAPGLRMQSEEQATRALERREAERERVSRPYVR